MGGVDGVGGVSGLNGVFDVDGCEWWLCII